MAKKKQSKEDKKPEVPQPKIPKEMEAKLKEIKSMMETNLLLPTDDAYLSDALPIYLFPANN